MNWIPKIVGGTDYGDEPVPVVTEVVVKKLDNIEQKVGLTGMIDTHGAANSSEPPSVNDIEYVTSAELAVYAESTVSADVTWEYGPEEQVRDGTRISKGQYVEEFRAGILFKTFWVSL